ncbi:CynX/NimT family MFS transporter [Paenibacillus hodogayensis]|uniref:CynX/NimT family MFS transporter n=1 Tax=Paenibacillus hodogayensis TaxID=279208 RepID=A0ABV5W1C7_9BACL
MKKTMWLFMIGFVLVGANLRAPISSVGPILTSIQESLGLSNTAAGSLTTVPLLAFALLSPFASRIAGKFGTEKTIFWSLLALTVGIGVRLFPSAGPLFIGTALIGLAIAVCNVLLPAIIKLHFPLGIGLMTGVYGVFMNVFAAFASGLSDPLASTPGIGWQGALGFWGILSLIALAVWSFQLTGGRQASQPAGPAAAKTDSIWRSPLAWTVTLFMGIQSLQYYTLMTWLPQILHANGYSSASAGWMLAAMQVALIPMTFLMPIVAGKMRNQRLLAAATSLGFLLGIAGLLLGIFIPLAVILLGMASGSAFGLAMMFFALRTRDGRQAAELSGMAQSFGYLLAAFGPMVFGWLHDRTDSWTAPLLVLLVFSVVLLMAGLGAGKGSVHRPRAESELSRTDAGTKLPLDPREAR